MWKLAGDHASGAVPSPCFFEHRTQRDASHADGMRISCRAEAVLDGFKNLFLSRCISGRPVGCFEVLQKLFVPFFGYAAS